MVELLLKRYLWLIDTLKRGGEMTFEEVADRWERSAVNDNGSALTKRTFYNHCQAVARHFGIDIECRRGRGLNTYRIVNPEAIEENSLTKWAIDSFSLGELLMGNADIADKILLEEIPSGREWLEPILTALQQNREISIEYENFVHVKYSGAIQLLCVKLFKRRWYVLALLSNGRKRIFALDRIKTLELTENRFEYPDGFSPADYFRDVFGIIAGIDHKPEDIIIRTYAELPGYLRTLPMHHSQHELSTENGHTDFSLRLIPTFDFIQELLLHRDQLEVLSPQSLREEIASLIYKMSDRYDKEGEMCYYALRANEIAPVQALQTLFDIYIDNCGMSTGIRTLAENASFFWIEKWLKDNPQSEKEISFYDAMDLMSERYREDKEEIDNYDITYLNKEQLKETCEMYAHDYTNNEADRIVLYAGVNDFIKKQYCI